MKLNINNSIFMGIMVALLVSATFIYSYFRPYEAVETLEQALKENNALIVDQSIDYGAVKENLRRQLLRVIKQTSSEQTDDELCKTVKITLDHEIVDLVLDQWLSVDNLKKMFSGYAPSFSDASKDASTHIIGLALNEGAKHYLTLDTFEQSIKVINVGEAQTLSFIYRRSGFMAWRLVEIQWPRLESVLESIQSKQADIHRGLKSLCAVKAPVVTPVMPPVKKLINETKQTPQAHKPSKVLINTDAFSNEVGRHLNSALSRACQLENRIRSRQGSSAPSPLCAGY
jgi:hypothetical protein